MLEVMSNSLLIESIFPVLAYCRKPIPTMTENMKAFMYAMEN